MPKKKRTAETAKQSFIVDTFRKYTTVKTLIFLVLSAAVIVLMASTVNLRAMGRSLASADPFWLAASFLLYTLSNLCKSARYSIMLRESGVTQTKMFAITAYQNFFNQILPARTGELTLIYYLKKSGGAVSKGLHVLIVTRIYDLIIVAVFFLSSAVLFWGSRVNTGLLVAGCIALAASIASLFFLKWIVEYGWKFFLLVARKMSLSKLGIVRKLTAKLEPVVHEFSDYRTARQIPALVLSSIAVWSVLYCFAYATIRAFNVQIGFLANVVGNTGQVLANVLPVNSFGSLGTLEAGWAGGFLLVGMSKQDAVTTAFGYHIITFAAAALIAALCWAIFRSGKRK